jgi:ribonuclease Z
VSFKITILGSGAALPTLTRNPTSHYIDCNNRHILIDCGEGTQIQMRQFGVKFQRITHILISHLHGDHFFGLVGLLSTMHLLGRDKGITVYGPIGLEEIIRSQLEIGGAIIGFTLSFVSLDGKTPSLLFEDKMVEIRTFPLNHRIPTNGFIIKEKTKKHTLLAELFKADGLSLTFLQLFKNGENAVDENGKIYDYKDYTLPPVPAKSYAFCSDTCYDENIIPFLNGVDLLYHEATFTEELADRARATYHSTAEEAAIIAKKSGVKKLLLGHLSARYENGNTHLMEAKTKFDNVEIVEDGRVYEIR